MHKPKYNNIEELPSQSPIYLPGQGGVPVHSGTNRQCKWSIHSTGAQGLKAAQLSRRSETFTDANRVCVWVCVITVCVCVWRCLCVCTWKRYKNLGLFSGSRLLPTLSRNGEFVSPCRTHRHRGVEGVVAQRGRQEVNRTEDIERTLENTTYCRMHFHLNPNKMKACAERKRVQKRNKKCAKLERKSRCTLHRIM